MKILILEPGAWGTALGILLSKENEVSFWYENQKLASKIARVRENEKLPGTKIPEKIFISSRLKELILDNDLVIIASPSFNFRKTLLKFKRCTGPTSANRPLMGIAKGIEKETLKLPSQIVEEILPETPYAHLSGPGFAKEVVRGKPAEEVIASKNRSFLRELKKIFQIKPLKVSITTDLVGVQLAGAIKNSLAIIISLVEAGCKKAEIKKIKPNPVVEFRQGFLKENLISRSESKFHYRAKLIKLGLNEMIKIGVARGGKRKTFLGPAGLGDLVLTSTNLLSRNFQFGKNLYFNAEKMRQDIRERKITVEGFDNTFALYKFGKIKKIDLPMINELYKVIYKKTSPEKTIKNLIKMVE